MKMLLRGTCIVLNGTLAKDTMLEAEYTPSIGVLH